MSGINEQNMQHGMDWTGQDLAGWYLTEKFDGCRSFWDGFNLWTRGGKCVDIPADWRAALPSGVPLDCELYHGTDGVYRCGAALRYGRFLPGMELVVFDAPAERGDYLSRMAAASRLLAGCMVARVAEVKTADSTADAVQMMRHVQSKGGEGVMARHPSLVYSSGRTHQLIKVKHSDPCE